MENGLIKVFRLLKYAFNVIIILKGTQDPHQESGVMPRKTGTRTAEIQAKTG